MLAEVEREAPDVVLVGGDVSAGPFPVECLELLRSLGDRAVWIRGNADRELHDWPAEQLSDEQRAFLRGLPETVVLDVDDLGPVLFCHGSPRSDDEIITERSPDAPARGRARRRDGSRSSSTGTRTSPTTASSASTG